MNTEPEHHEEPKAIVTVPAQSGIIATIDVRDASSEGVALMRARVENQKKMLAIAIGLTSESQWTVFGDSVYPTGGAADTILRRAFGLTWGEKKVTIETTEEGDLEAVSVAWLMQGDRQVEQFEGRRRMGGFIKTEADMRKGAVENMKSVAVRDLLGLRFRTVTELRDMGLNIGSGVKRVEFQNRGKDESGGLVVPFGKNKGVPITELTDKQLEWYIGAAKQTIADPEKAKFRAKEEKWLAALESELSGRSQSPADKMPAWDEPREPGSEG